MSRYHWFNFKGRQKYSHLVTPSSARQILECPQHTVQPWRFSILSYISIGLKYADAIWKYELWRGWNPSILKSESCCINHILYIVQVKNKHNSSQYAVEKLLLTWTHYVPLIWIGTSNLSSSVGDIFTLFEKIRRKHECSFLLDEKKVLKWRGTVTFYKARTTFASSFLSLFDVWNWNSMRIFSKSAPKRVFCVARSRS